MAHDDGRLMRRIAVLMRWGTGSAAILLVGGAVLGWAGGVFASTAAVVAGCCILVVLPVARLLLMLGTFTRQKDTLYVGITILVIGLVLASAATGLLR